jgi:methionyl-tRNA formyltransferase
MENKKQTLIFFGNERLATGVTTGAPTLQALIDAGYHVAAVVANFEQAKSRNGRELEIAKVAEKHGIPVLLPNKPSEILSQLKSYNAQLGILVAYGRIVPQTVIDIFPRGIVNIHPSLLPQHRGPTPIESVILGGAHETGVSIMALVAAMDAGPIYDQARISLTGNETKQALVDTLLSHGKNLLIEALPGIIDGSLQPKPQDDSQTTYDRLLTKEDSILDLHKPAEQLEREVRAFIEWPKSRIMLVDTEIIVTKAHVLPLNDLKIGTIWLEHKQFGFQTSNGVLVIDALKPAGKPEMTAEAFLAGYRHLLK